MDTLQPKRPTYEAASAGRTKSNYPNIDYELHQELATVGVRARKHVSDGHLTRGTSIPSYNGLAIGTLDQEKLRNESLSQHGARHSQSTNSIPTPFYMINDNNASAVGSKRTRSAWEASTTEFQPIDGDEYGDTEEDEEIFDPNRAKPNLINPNSANTVSSSFSSSNNQNSHSAFFPTGYRTTSSNTGDFEEANFLRHQQ